MRAPIDRFEPGGSPRSEIPVLAPPPPGLTPAIAEELAQTEQLAAEVADLVMSMTGGLGNVVALADLRTIHASLARRAAKLRRA